MPSRRSSRSEFSLCLYALIFKTLPQHPCRSNCLRGGRFDANPRQSCFVHENSMQLLNLLGLHVQKSNWNFEVQKSKGNRRRSTQQRSHRRSSTKYFCAIQGAPVGTTWRTLKPASFTSAVNCSKVGCPSYGGLRPLIALRNFRTKPNE